MIVKRAAAVITPQRTNKHKTNPTKQRTEFLVSFNRPPSALLRLNIKTIITKILASGKNTPKIGCFFNETQTDFLLCLSL
jgi:hypothetical protein